MYLYAERNGICYEEKLPTGPLCTKEIIKANLDAFVSRLPFQVQGVGIAVAGLVDKAHAKLLVSDVLPQLAGMTAEFLSEGRFDCRLINDVKAAAIAEQANYPNAGTIAVVMNGTGIAATILSYGQLLEGAGGYAGELGSCMFPYHNGFQSLDSLAGGAAILKKANMDAQRFTGLLAEGDPFACGIIEEAARYFGLALSHLIHLCNPDIIVVGGGTVQYPKFMEQAEAMAKSVTLPELFAGTEFKAPYDPKRIVALGAMRYINITEKTA